jgi:hypothetical protein
MFLINLKITFTFRNDRKKERYKTEITKNNETPQKERGRETPIIQYEVRPNQCFPLRQNYKNRFSLEQTRVVRSFENRSFENL